MSRSADPCSAYLMALARGDSRPPAGTHPGELDQEQFLQLAISHQVDPLCYWRLRHWSDGDEQHGWHAMPDAIVERLRLSFLHHSMRNEYSLRQVVELQERLRGAGVESVVFKGSYVASYAYPDPGCRPISDVDLCVRETDYHTAVEALQRLDYQSDSALPATPAEALHRAHYARQLRFSARGKRPVELHFRMINIGPPTADEDWMWADAVDVTTEAGSMRVPGPDAMLLHLILHANQHGFSLLRLLYDVRFALEHLERRWQPVRLIEHVRRQRCSTSAYFGLELAKQLCGAKVADELLAALRPNALRRGLFSRLWHLPEVRCLRAPRSRAETESARLYFLQMGSMLDKARYMRGILRENGGVAATFSTARKFVSKRTRGS